MGPSLPPDNRANLSDEWDVIDDEIEVDDVTPGTPLKRNRTLDSGSGARLSQAAKSLKKDRHKARPSDKSGAKKGLKFDKTRSSQQSKPAPKPTKSKNIGGSGSPKQNRPEPKRTPKNSPPPQTSQQRP